MPRPFSETVSNISVFFAENFQSMRYPFIKVAFVIFVFSAVSQLYSDKFHEVQKGETLYSISKSYGVSVDSLKAANGFSDNSIKVGQKIKIPDSSLAAKATDTKVSSSKKNSDCVSYTVQKGETWFGISKKYGISVAELQKLNGANGDSPLKVGQKLKVPSQTSSKSTAVASSSMAATKTQTPELKKSDPHNYSGKKADSSLVWPVKTENVVYINGKVGGVSIAAKKDEEVKAIRAGTVMFSGSYRGFGNVVFIQSKTGHIYAYTGLGSIEVAKGDYINYSSEIGTAGVDTYTGKSQISLMVFQNGQPIDPAKAPRG